MSGKKNVRQYYNSSTPLSYMNCMCRCCVIRIIGHLPCALVGIDQTPTSRLGAACLVERIHRDVSVYSPIAKKNISPLTRMRRTSVNDQSGQGVG